ncbi:MAG: hypothetical protein M1820_007610 [Bogoriella megaspora]|nr:MAG: hypothetical protein M1820_007610 [Bogoriella megaspora]
MLISMKGMNQSRLVGLAGLAALLIISLTWLAHGESDLSLRVPAVNLDRFPFSVKNATLWGKPKEEKLAYATYLTGTEAEPEDLWDKYLVGVRMLGYQIMHNPSTRTKRNIPFIVMVTDEVPEIKRQRLQDDGFKVIPIEHIPMPSWIDPLFDRWSDVMTKLRLWELTEFSRIAFLDGDVVLRKNIDDVFDIPESQWHETLAEGEEAPQDNPYPQKKFSWLSRTNESKSSESKDGKSESKELKKPAASRTRRSKSEEDTEDEEEDILAPDYVAPSLPPIPTKYCLAGNSEMKQQHSTPPKLPSDFVGEDTQFFNAGFMVLGPSKEMFDYYMAYIHTPHIFESRFPEQGMLQHAHRRSSRMPWQFWGTEWNAIFPNANDLGLGEAEGARTEHMKWWLPREWKNRNATEWFLAWRYKMEGFYERWDEEKGISYPINEHYLRGEQ